MREREIDLLSFLMISIVASDTVFLMASCLPHPAPLHPAFVSFCSTDADDDATTAAADDDAAAADARVERPSHDGGPLCERQHRRRRTSGGRGDGRHGTIGPEQRVRVHPTHRIVPSAGRATNENGAGPFQLCVRRLCMKGVLK